MPVQVSYPGVYIEEIPSGVRTITGVATLIAAFIGRALRGPTDEPVVINSYGDFERIFGGASADSSLGPAVLDFFQNGGAQAIVVRLLPRDRRRPGDGRARRQWAQAGGRVSGAWGNTLRVRIEEVSQQVADQLGIEKAKLFNLLVRDTHTGETEAFFSMMIAPEASRRVDDAVRNGSRLVRVKELPAAVPAKNDEPAEGKNIWEDDDASNKVIDANKAVDSDALQQDNFTGTGKEAAKEGLYALEKADLFNLLCIPPYKDGDVDPDSSARGGQYCEERRAMLLVDPPCSVERQGRRQGQRRRTSARTARTPRCSSRGSAAQPAPQRSAGRTSFRAAPSPASSRAPTPSAASGRRRPASRRRWSACRS